MTSSTENGRAYNTQDFIPVTGIALHVMPRTITAKLASISGTPCRVDEERFSMVAEGQQRMAVIHHGQQATLEVPVQMGSMWSMDGLAYLFARIEQIIDHDDLSPAFRERWGRLVYNARQHVAQCGIWAIDTESFQEMRPEDFSPGGRHYGHDHVACSPAETAK